MKEFIEKLIERLESEQNFTDFIGIKEVIEIVNQLAKEYNNDFCRWEKYEDKHIYYNNCKWRNEDIVIIDEYTVSQFKFCPYCGKKIKVVK